MAAAGCAAVLTVALAACGGSQFPDSSHPTRANPSAAGGSTPVDATPTSGVTDPPSSVRARPAPTTPTTTLRPTPTIPAPAPVPAPAPAQPAADVSLRSLVPSVDTLGPQWSDDGESVTSRDLDYPPLDCAPYTHVFDERRDSLIHEFSFLASADGSYEQGHVAMLAVSAASADAVSSELAAVLRGSFASCAAGTAVNWFNDHGEGTIGSASPRVIALAVGGSTVIWRVTITGRSTSGVAITFFMDIAYLAHGSTLVKARVASCPCRPPVAGDAEIMPGELSALRSITLRLGATRTVAPEPAPTGTGPANLN